MNSGTMDRGEFISAAEKALNEGRFQELMVLAQGWLARFPEDPEGKIALCQALIRMGRLGDALEMLSQAEGLVFRLGGIYAALGRLCEESGLIAEAGRYYQRYLSLNPDTPEATEIKSRLAGFLRSRDSEPGDDTEEEALAPEFYTLTAADLYIRQGHLEMAMRILRKLSGEGQAEALAKLEEVKRRQKEKLISAYSLLHRERVIGELERWLGNLMRMRANVG